nr:DUF4465 domain-containing protein [uncultured Carboxylicivirga sp.]
MKQFSVLAFLLSIFMQINAQLNESFEGEVFPPDGWTVINEGGSNTWESESDGFAGKCTRIKYNSDAHNDWLITPQITIKENGKLSFYTKNYSSNYKDQFNIKLSTTGYAQEDFTEEIALKVEPGTSWEELNYDLSAYAGQNVYIAFQAISEDKYYLFLDEIKVFAPSPMEVQFINAAQPNTDVASIGASNMEILRVNVKTEGALTQESASQFSFSTNGTTDVTDIEKAKLYYSASSSDFSDATLFGECNTPNGEFAVTGSQQLNEGNNYFWLAYDISSEATADNVIDAECNSVTVASVVHTTDNAAPEGNRLLSKILNMQGGTNTYMVNGSVAFYDDGGKDGNYTEGFEGTITFKPATTGKKVKIEWNSFAIFNTSSVGYNDIFKVYNGTIADEANLIGQYSNMPPPITSMADDGSVTIFFQVKTGVPKAGWDALVKEITPQNMVFDAALMYQINTEDLAAGDVDQEMALIEVSTQYTENKLAADEFSLSINGTTDASDISKAKIYYTAGSAEFSNDNLFGEIESPSGDYIITGSQDLVEGSNFFWLVYDVSNTATEGNVLDAEVNAITISGASHSLDSPSAEGSRTIDNTFYMPLSGTHSKTIYAPVSFVDDGGEGANYNPNAMSTVTFLPATEGEVVKMDFESFEVLYQASVSGTKAFFTIYNGSGTATDDIIWQADDTNCDEGPIGITTSTAPDGALTVKFVGNALYSSQTKAGWKGNIYSAIPSDMEYESVEVSQSTQIVKAGSTDQEILHVQLNLSGTTNPVSEVDFTFNTDGTTNNADISAARLYSTGYSSDFTTESQSGESVLTPDGEFTITHVGELHEGVNHFWLVYDIASSATVDNVVDASINKITIDGDEYIVSNGVPDGNRTIKRLYEMEAGTHEVVVNQNPLNFYDDGGLNENYSKSFEGTVTFIPETEGQRVRLDISALQITWAEDFEIYNGAEVTDDALIMELDDDDNITSAQDPIIAKSTSEDGKLTVVFKSGSYSTPEAGFDALVYTFEPQPYSYQGASVEQGINTALRGESNANILRIAASFAGETTAANVNAISFSTEGTTASTDIASAQLFYSGTDEVFNPVSSVEFGELQESPAGTVKVEGNLDVAVEGTVYFWLMYNVSSDAVVNNVLDAQLTSIEVNSVEHDIAEGNPDGSAVIAAGLKGNYTIGSDTEDDFANFTDAFSALAENGVEEPVTITVKDGTYSERSTLPHIKGTSATNLITFVSESNTPENVIIESEESASSDYNSPDDAVLYINGADYVVFKDITVKSSQKTYDALVLINNQSRYVTFDGCVLDAPVETISTAWNAITVACIKNDAEDVANQNNDFITIKNCHFKGGSIGAYIGGTGYVALPKEKGAQILSNTFEGQFSKGIYVNNEEDAFVDGNTIVNNTSPYSSYIGIDAYRMIGESTIANNTITIDRSLKSYGIECRPVSGTAQTSARIYNNAIAFIQTNNASNGILLDDKCTNAQLFYNTVVMQGNEATGSNALYINGSSSEIPENLELKNNIFINNAGGLAIAVQRDEFMNGLSFDYNNIYSTGTTLASVGYSDNLVSYADLAAWQEKATASHSISESVEFYSNSDLHVKEVGGLNSALPILYITTDFEDQERSNDTPTIGADEFTESDFDAPVFNDGYPKVEDITAYSADLLLSFNEAGNAWWVVLPAGDNAPTVAQVKAGTDAQDNELADNLKGNVTFAADIQSKTSVEELNDNTEYVIYIVAEDNLGNTMDAVASLEFTTDFKSTEVATFEDVNYISDAVFEDGTAMFTNVTVAEGEGVDGSAKYGVIATNTQATVNLTNTTEGLTLEGFFYKSTAAITVKGGVNGADSDTELSYPASSTWSYADMQALHDVTEVYITAGEGELMLDNFADVPAELHLTSLYDVTINRGEMATLTATIEGGVKPYSYLWTSVNDENAYEEAQPQVAPQSSCEYTLMVTDARGTSFAESMIVNVNGGVALPATFEGLLNQSESHWAGNPEQEMSEFYSGSFKFNNYYFPAYDSWGNFGYSNETSTSYNGLDDQFHSTAGSGANNTETYGVVYVAYGNPEIELTNTQEGEQLTGCYLTNTAYAASSMENGDAFAGDAFTDGDWFKLVINGFDSEGESTGSIDFYLADYRSENAEDHYVLKDWKWVDLSVLGAVQKLTFSISGSRNNAYGLLTPGYVCIDELNESDHATSIRKNNTEVKIYPNPTRDILNIKMADNNVQRIEVYTIAGRKVMTQLSTSQSLEQINLSRLQQGTYIIRIVSDAGVVTQKVQKL